MTHEVFTLLNPPVQLKLSFLVCYPTAYFIYFWLFGLLISNNKCTISYKPCSTIIIQLLYKEEHTLFKREKCRKCITICIKRKKNEPDKMNHHKEFFHSYNNNTNHWQPEIVTNDDRDDNNDRKSW